MKKFVIGYITIAVLFIGVSYISFLISGFSQIEQWGATHSGHIFTIFGGVGLLMLEIGIPILLIILWYSLIGWCFLKVLRFAYRYITKPE